MTDEPVLDPGLFGLWPKEAGYDPFAGERFAADVPWLETKAADGQGDLRPFLNAMTGELREQFETFQKIRRSAEARLAGEADETAEKLAKADLKAAIDALSLIMRTLEKLDSLQRSIAQDKALEAERNFDEAGYETARRQLLDLVEARANERAHTLFAAWKAGLEHDAGADTEPIRPG